MTTTFFGTGTVMANYREKGILRRYHPGLWMDHCHNLDHAQKGMTMHAAYENVYTPFAIGSETGNSPE
ncbi:multicopper oxidase domain-containing protein [Lederbergia ruris]|nr:multicopper oxidase domain-containing protein [Lederbergia ruris]